MRSTPYAWVCTVHSIPVTWPEACDKVTGGLSPKTHSCKTGYQPPLKGLTSIEDNALDKMNTCKAAHCETGGSVRKEEGIRMSRGSQKNRALGTKLMTRGMIALIVTLTMVASFLLPFGGQMALA